MNELSNQQYFPYKLPRPGQIELINAIREDVLEGKHLCVEAVNGFGKTIAALSGAFPVLQDSRYGIIYVARTHKQLDRVMEELKLLTEISGITGIEMRGRKSSCLNPIVLKYARTPQLAMFICWQLRLSTRCPFYTNLLSKMKRKADYYLKFVQSPLTGLELRNLCQSEGICPYELTKKILSEVKVVATTYNQIFDPQISSAFFESFGRPLSHTVLLLDEVHNLPRIAVEIGSENIQLHTVRQAAVEAKRNALSGVVNFCNSIEKEISFLFEKSSEQEIRINPSRFNNRICKRTRIQNLSDYANQLYQIGNNLIKNLLLAGKPPISNIYVLARFFVKWCQSLQRLDTVHFLVRNSGVSRSQLELVALDPRLVTKPILTNCHSSVHLSGTLQPIKAHIDLVGLQKATRSLNLPSPFSQDQILPIISFGVSTAMRFRTPPMFEKIANRIAEVCRATPHNVGVFVPSYTVLQALCATQLTSMIDKKIFIEKPGLSSRENDAIIRSFKKHSQSGAVLLGVLSGRNSEGEDYPGKEMETVVIVGVPFAKPSPRETTRINYFEQQFPQKGRVYGYLLPAMRSASQAAGRSVRQLEDRGVVVFLDDRYSTSYCQQFLPRWINERIKYLNDADELLFNQLVSFYARN